MYGNSWIVLFAELNQAPSLYLMLQHVGRVATPKLVPRNCLRYLQTTLIMGGRIIGLRIFVRYCLKKEMKNKRRFGKTWHFFSSNGLFLIFGICQIVLRLTGFVLVHCDSQKNWSVEIMQKFNRFLSLEVNILSIQFLFSSSHVILLERQ